MKPDLAPSTNRIGRCVSDCSGMADGDYQSCTTCERFVTCSNGHFHDMPCAPNDPPLVWDDVTKTCEYESTTCPSTSPTSTAPPPLSSSTSHPSPGPGPCVSDCSDMDNGDYQSCETCEGFVTCSNGHKYEMPCAPSDPPLVWDDVKKRCEYESTTCPSTSPPSTAPPPSSSSTSHPSPGPGPCVSDCSDMDNGDYQSCETCEGFVTCSNGHKYEMPCAPSDPPLVWDDVKKRCEYESTTCPSTSPPSTAPPPSSSSTSHPSPGPGPCVSDCSGMDNGDYQSCETCEGFVTCSNGHKYEMPCAPSDPPLVWDDVKKRCEYESSTCPPTSPTSTAPPPSSSSTSHPSPGPGPCVSDCSDMDNGDYQSCETCEGFVTCSNGHKYEMPCAPSDPPLVWDDVKKRCEYESTTCPPTSPTSTGAPPHSTTSHSTTVRPTGTPGPCVSDCTDMPDGSYPSCKSNEEYVICNRSLLCEKACPAGEVWVDAKKRCMGTTECVSDCRDMPDGFYQSCKFCDAYVECSYGLLCEIACKDGYFWDDREKKCVIESTTCPIPSTTIRPPTSGPTSPPTTSRRPPGPGPCVSDCSGMANGDYQSCYTCERFVTCSNGHYYDMPCAPNHPGQPPLVWDDVKKRCEWTSSTCSIP